MAKVLNFLPFKLILVIGFIFALGLAAGYKSNDIIGPEDKKEPEKNTPRAFLSEIYDKAKENYWDNISDAQLLEFFKLAMSKYGAAVAVPKFESKEKFLEAFDKSAASLNREQQNQLAVSMASAVLATLNPPGRSGLFNQQQEEQLKNTVENINPEKDLYKDLGLGKGASEKEVLSAFTSLQEELKKDKSPEAAEKLQKITYAKDTLTKKESKERYDQNKVEPTIFTKAMPGNILYFQFKKFSPATMEEFPKAFEDYKDEQLNSLVIDLRGNVGGTIDATAYYLGYFLGPNQNAFEFYHKGEYLPFKTPTNKLASLSRFKQVVILVDSQTQSSAEMMTASLKKYHNGVVIGIPTKGWGTVERIFPLDNQIDGKQKYSMFLVHSITLREDNQPIEGKGVDPDISISDPGWKKQLLSYFNNDNLVSAVSDIYSNK